VLVLLALAVGLALVGAASIRARSAVQSVGRLRHRLQAGYMSESALALALSRIGRGARGGGFELAAGGARGARRIGGEADAPEVVAWGQRGGVDRAITCRAVVQPVIWGAAADAPARVFAADLLVLPAGGSPLDGSASPAAAIARARAARGR
jgi:hypothetical protein